jgi:UDP-glucose 4-epimerase
VGSRGFLGTTLCRVAREAGHEVREFEIDRPVLTPGGLAPGVDDVEAVYWLASRCNPATAEQHPEWAEAELGELREFLDLLGKLPVTPRVILASSGGTIYGNGAPPFSETSPLAPIGAYGAAKQAAEDLLWASGVPGAAARISNPYGPGQRAGRGQGVVAQWFDDILKDRVPTLIGSPETARDYIYIDDVAEGLVRLGCSEVSGPVNLGDGVPTTLRQLASTMAEVTGREIAFVEAPARAFDVTAVWLDVQRAQRELGWVPTTPLRAGLEATWSAITHAARQGRS